MTAVLEIETTTRVLPVIEIKMYHARAVAKWRGMMAAAQEKMGGVSSGIGFIGSPGWVVTGSLVLGALESAISNSNAKIGIKLLGEANVLLEEMHGRSVFIPVSSVVNIDRPQPEIWQARQGTIDFMMLGHDFFRVKLSDNRELNVRWSAVTSAAYLP